MSTPWVLVCAVGLLAGGISALTRVAAPFMTIPILVLGFGVDIRRAIAASLVAVVATTSNCAVVYLRNGCSNIGLAIYAVIAAALGALAGAVLSAQMPTVAIGVAFGSVLLYSAHLLWCTPEASVDVDGCATAMARRPAEDPEVERGRCDPAGLHFMFFAGSLSGLVGIGPAAAEIIEMDQSIRRPQSISGTTAHFMIGVTAAVSTSVYLQHGYMDAELATALMIGVYLGSILGAAARSYAVASSRYAPGNRLPPVVDETLAMATSGFSREH